MAKSISSSPINPSLYSLCNLLGDKSRCQALLDRASFPLPPGRWARGSSAHQTRNLVSTQTSDLLWADKITDWGWTAMLPGPRQSWQRYHLWEIVVWATVLLHLSSCKADRPQSTLLLGLLCSLIPTHVWYPAWRTLAIQKFEETVLQRTTLNTSRNIVPPSQGQKSVHKHFWVALNFPRKKAFSANSRLHFTSESHGLVPHFSETRCMSLVMFVLCPTRAARSIFSEVFLSTVCLCFHSLSPRGGIDSV